MRKAVVHKYGPREREYLGFILQPAKGRRENDTVVIPHIRGPYVLRSIACFMFRTAALGAIQLLPFHGAQVKGMKAKKKTGKAGGGFQVSGFGLQVAGYKFQVPKCACLK